MIHGWRFERDVWLSDVLGQDAFLVLPLPDEDGNVSLPVFLKGFYYAKVPTTQIRIVRNLTDAGFYLVCVQVTLTREGGGWSPHFPPGPCAVRTAVPEDRCAVLDLAASCFTLDRFHADLCMPAPLADALKREWLDGYFKKTRGDRLLVAEADGTIFGFLAVVSKRPNGSTCHIVDEIAVRKDYQGRGVGTALLAHLLQAESGGGDTFRVGTQVANIRSLRLYERMGFRAEKSEYVLHRHVR